MSRLPKDWAALAPAAPAPWSIAVQLTAPRRRALGARLPVELDGPFGSLPYPHLERQALRLEKLRLDARRVPCRREIPFRPGAAYSFQALRGLSLADLAEEIEDPGGMAKKLEAIERQVRELLRPRPPMALRKDDEG